jgi:predicted site-specific integrase-resolvase
MLSSEQVAKKLGITPATLSRYLSAGKVPAPKTASAGGMTIYQWSEEDIERARALLPRIKNGRKTRYQKLREKQNKTPARASQSKPKPHKKK